MSQNRDAPAYQEYAASMLSRLPFRTMSLQDRGLLYTMRLECWVNLRLPHNQNELAKVLGLPVEEVAESLAVVMPFFEVMDGFILSPELENYRVHLAERKIKQSQGGKRGSAITNSKRSRSSNPLVDGVASKASSTSRLTHQAAVESSVKPRSEKPSQNQPLRVVEVDDSFVSAYESVESYTSDDYARASGGG